MPFLANREFGLDKHTKPTACALPTAAELRDALAAAEGSEVRAQLAMLFDEGTFVETAAFTKRGYSDFITTDKMNEFEGVITGYGAIDGKLVFAFAEDASRMGGAIDERHAKKICDLYSMAMSNGSPVIAIFNSTGTDIFEGTVGLAAYGRIMSAVAKASGVIPQIAFVAGKCIRTAAAIAAMFDFTVKADDAVYYVSSQNEEKCDSTTAFCGTAMQCSSYIRSLISFLPQNAADGVIALENASDNLNRKLGELDFSGEALSAISVIADNGVFYEIGKDKSNLTLAFATIGGVKCGIVATSFSKDEGRISSKDAGRAARFVNFCDSFSVPVLTLVDSLGLTLNSECDASAFSAELAKLAYAYASSTTPKVTVILGHAIGASFVLLGSKALGADIVYALDDAEIGALPAESGVAFAWDKYITEENSRDKLINEWKATVSSPSVAASSGEIDDIIGTNELRMRICSALLMLSAKGSYSDSAKRKVLPI